MVDRASLTSAERQLLDVQLEEERLEAQLAEAESRFRRFFGVHPNGVGLPPAIFTLDELRARASSWREAPELIGTAAEIVALRSDLEAAKAEFKPNVRLRTGASSPILESDNTSVSAGVFLEYQLGDGGRRAAQVDAAEDAIAAAEARFEAIKSDLETASEAALEQYISISDLIRVVRQQIEALDEERQTLTSQLTSGQSSIQQLVEVEILAYRARARRIGLLAQRRALELEIASRQGALLERLGVGL
jgi:outer membrane protein TolC